MIVGWRIENLFAPAMLPKNMQKCFTNAGKMKIAVFDFVI
jgi:hypothetical protein